MAHSVSVTQMPDELTRRRRKAFLREIQQATGIDHPHLVLDCSNVCNLDTRTIRLLLRCLEEAMKRNGDIRLARVGPQALAALEQSGAARLFRIYNSSTDAAKSFHSFHQPVLTPAPLECEQQVSS